MSVGVQKMVRPIASGVAFTLNPTNGDRSQVAIDANWGLGEPVVSGEVTPDNYLVDKVLCEITRRKVVEQDESSSGWRATGSTGGASRASGPPARASPTPKSRPSPGSPGRPRRHYGCPQDIEWAARQ